MRNIGHIDLAFSDNSAFCHAHDDKPLQLWSHAVAVDKNNMSRAWTLHSF